MKIQPWNKPCSYVTFDRWERKKIHTYPSCSLFFCSTVASPALRALAKRYHTLCFVSLEKFCCLFSVAGLIWSDGEFQCKRKSHLLNGLSLCNPTGGAQAPLTMQGVYVKRAQEVITRDQNAISRCTETPLLFLSFWLLCFNWQFCCYSTVLPQESGFHQLQGEAKE